MSGVEESANVAQAVLGAISLGAQVSGSSGGLTWSSDQITYPKDLQSVGKATQVDVHAAEFTGGAVTESRTVFNMKGSFSHNPPVMANVHFYEAESTTYSESSLTFQAKAMTTPYGPADDPKIRFECSGRFDPLGPGDVEFNITLEVDSWGSCYVVDSPHIQDNSTGAYAELGRILGFSLAVKQA
jgi:hypothetical protein